MVALIPVDVDDERLGRLLQLYIHEWSGLIPVAINTDALYVYEKLPLYRDRDARAAFLFLDPATATPVGFALVMRDATGRWHVEEFFVIAGARRRGLGRNGAAALFAALRGRWTLTVRQENRLALKFWRSVSPACEERVEVGDDGVTRTRLSFAV